MMRPLLVALLQLIAASACVLPCAAAAADSPVNRWRAEAGNVTIYRDDWGIAHVYGKTDADAVFGMEYAQAEDDFNRVESNYLDALGWHSQADGESSIYIDLRSQLFVDTSVLRAEYARSPAWLKSLMGAFADGLNYYLYTHPEVRPKVITHFEPWMALAFTEGSIGGDIETGVDVPRLAEFYGGRRVPAPPVARITLPPPEPQGSNGIAIAPSVALDHHAILWINPHTSFYFRSELQMVSGQGLDAYGAVTWGQFFIYQGFNATAGWMHTSSGVRNISWFLETVTRKSGSYYYSYGGRELPVTTRRIVVRYKAANGAMAEKAFTAYYTQHGPVIARIGNKWESVNLMQRPIVALMQDFTRTKARDYAQFRRTMQLHADSSNNTIFADSEGNIAYWHSNWIPRRSDAFDWGKPVDGSDPATASHGLLTLAQTPHLLDPPNGWLYNSNNWPWSAAGPYSPKRQDFPRYVDRGMEESARGYHALRVLTNGKNWTMASVSAAAFDSYLPAFASMIPVLVKAYDATPESDPLKARLSAQIAVLRSWNYRWGVNSVATSLAVFWGEDIFAQVRARADALGISPNDYVMQRATRQELLASLAAGSERLTANFGGWQTPWGRINRFQRFNDDISPRFDDSRPSIPVPFTSSVWGSLAAFGAHAYPNTRKWYGSEGNSFVAVVEFAPRVRAWAVTAGGESGNPASPHFADQATNYAMGALRPVYYYRSQLQGHIERQYHPGQAPARR